MSDVFISYAREDRAKAQALAKLLSQYGWLVWWDRVIPIGRSFDQVIEEAIDAAQCVIVLWSSTAVRSDWVKLEAREGVRRKILLPALLEEVKIPLEFRYLQAANLTDWSGEPDHSGLEELIQAVEVQVRSAVEDEISSPIGDERYQDSSTFMQIAANNSSVEVKDIVMLTQFEQQFLQIIQYARDNFRMIKGQRPAINVVLSRLIDFKSYKSAFSFTGSKWNYIDDYGNGVLDFRSYFEFFIGRPAGDFFHYIVLEVEKTLPKSYQLLSSDEKKYEIFYDEIRIVIRLVRTGFLHGVEIHIIKKTGGNATVHAETKP
jgi:hypothetical protein